MAFQAGDSERLEKSHHSDLTTTEKSPMDDDGLFMSQLLQSSRVLSRFCVNSMSCIS